MNEVRHLWININVVKDLMRSFTGNKVSTVLGYLLAILIILTLISILFS